MSDNGAGRHASPGRDHRRRIRRHAGGPPPEEGRRRRDGRRPPQPPAVPAADLPGRRRGPVLRRGRHTDPAHAQGTGERHRADGARSPASTSSTRQVILDRGEERLEYDSLFVACGGETSYFGHDEWQEVTCGLKTLADAVDLRDRIFGAFEEAERAADPDHAGRVADVRRRRRRPDRRRDLRAARDPRSSYDEAGLPADRSHERRGSSCSTPASGWSPRSASRPPPRRPRQLGELGVTVREHAMVTGIDSRGVERQDRRAKPSGSPPGPLSGQPACGPQA